MHDGTQAQTLRRALTAYTAQRSAVAARLAQVPANEVPIDPTDYALVAPAVLNRDGSLNLALLFAPPQPLSAAARRHLLRVMERAHAAYHERVTATALGQRAAARRVVEASEDELEMAAQLARLRGVRERMERKAAAITPNADREAPAVSSG